MNAEDPTVAAVLAEIDPARVKLANAHAHVCDLASGRLKWRMSIPVEKADSDLILCDALEEASRLLASAARLLQQQQEQLTKNEGAWAIDHVVRHGQVTAQKDYLECCCGATFWTAAAPSPDDSTPRERTR